MKIVVAAFTKLHTTGLSQTLYLRSLSTKATGELKKHDYAPSIDEIEIANEKYSEIQVQDRDHFGRGVFASKPFQTGDLLMSSNSIKTKTEKDSHTIQNGLNSHIVMDLPAVMINHSCYANVGIQDNEKTGAYDFFALSEITEGEELFLDYETTEHEIFGFACGCGSSRCRHELKGFKYHGEIVKAQYGEDFIASYLKKM